MKQVHPLTQAVISGVNRENAVAIKVLAGGAPVTSTCANNIGADGYASDAGTAVDVALDLLKA